MAENIRFDTEDSYLITGFSDRLYSWNAALKACPLGWHLASDEEWNILIAHFGGPKAALALKSSQGWDSHAWNESGNGTNKSGFSALPMGYRNDFGTFGSLGKGAFFWTSTSVDSKIAKSRSIYHNETGVEGRESNKYSAYSCRCVLD